MKPCASARIVLPALGVLFVLADCPATGCEPASLCRDSGQEFDSSSFAAQLQSGVDVGIARHVAVMGQFRAIFPIEDPGGGHHTIMGGVRVVF